MEEAYLEGRQSSRGMSIWSLSGSGMKNGMKNPNLSCVGRKSEVVERFQRVLSFLGRVGLYRNRVGLFLGQNLNFPSHIDGNRWESMALSHRFLALILLCFSIDPNRWVSIASSHRFLLAAGPVSVSMGIDGLYPSIPIDGWGFPGPRESLIQCFIKRNRATQSYYLFVNLSQALTDDGKFLLAARKCRRTTCTDYIISLQADDTSKGNDTYIGKLRSNFLGTKFIVYDALPPIPRAKIGKSWSTRIVGSKQISPRVHAGNYPVAHISYELNVLGSRGPRKMHCSMDTITASAIQPNGVAPTPTYLPISRVDSFPTIPFFRTKSNHLDKSLSLPLSNQEDGNSSLILRNKSPRWHEQLQCWCLNFHGRVTVASVKNFQLVASLENGVAGPEHDKVILQFGKVGKDVFTMDYRYPISAFQAFAICLSSFDTKIACE
ncbi:Tubby-like F-box protein 6 [Castilleja foliolosa]|uniref:Tubby-like F-box protein n=1 Tax=Castilleja foliolosa TaxID=1961234 RepID=A0ABD3E439_9LAMI